MMNYSLNLESLEREDPEYYSYRYRTIGTIFQGIILIVGVLGNVMVVLVVYRTRSMRSPTNCYLVSLAVADCLVLMVTVPQEIASYYLVGNLWLWGKVGCNIYVFCQYLGINASSLSLVAFTVERYIAICKPLHAHAVCTVARAQRIAFGVWIFATLYCSPWILLSGTSPLLYKGLPDGESCGFKLPRAHYLAYFFTDLVLFYVIPLILSCVLYTLIAKVLRSRRIAGSAQHMESTAPAREQKGLLGVITIYNNHNHSLGTADTLHFLPAHESIRRAFIEYFDQGMGIAEACRYHEGKLELDQESTEEMFASGTTNPSKRTVRYWHDQWRLLNLGPRTGTGLVEVVKMLAAVVVVFATLWLPYRGMLVYNSFATLFSGQRFMNLWFLMFAKTCVYINCAINPILYNAMSVKFRRAFRRTLCGGGVSAMDVSSSRASAGLLHHKKHPSAHRTHSLSTTLSTKR